MTQRVMCLSIRQPWAYLVSRGLKPIENRTWGTKYRGPLLIHTGLSIPIDDYQQAAYLAQQQEIALPSRQSLDRGGIVGVATLVDCVHHHDSPWFFGPIGWVLADARPVTFVPCAGQLGLFEAARSVVDMVMREVAA